MLRGEQWLLCSRNNGGFLLLVCLVYFKGMQMDHEHWGNECQTQGAVNARTQDTMYAKTQSTMNA